VRSYIATPFWLYRVAIIDAFYWFQRCFISFYFVYALLLTTFRLLFVVFNGFRSFFFFFFFFELLAALFCRLWLVQCNFTAFSVIWLLLFIATCYNWAKIFVVTSQRLLIYFSALRAYRHRSRGTFAAWFFFGASCGKTGSSGIPVMCEWRHLNIFAALSLVT